MKKLYEVIKLQDDGHRESIRIGEISPVYTDTKMKAKVARNNCNYSTGVFDDEGNKQKPFQFIITRGPDHRRGKVQL